MKVEHLSRKEANDILSQIKDDDEMRDRLAEVLRAELVGSRSSKIKPIRDIGRLRR